MKWFTAAILVIPFLQTVLLYVRIDMFVSTFKMSYNKISHPELQINISYSHQIKTEINSFINRHHVTYIQPKFSLNVEYIPDVLLLYIAQPTTLSVICIATASQICYPAVFLTLIELNYIVRQCDAL